MSGADRAGRGLRVPAPLHLPAPSIAHGRLLPRPAQVTHIYSLSLFCNESVDYFLIILDYFPIRLADHNWDADPLVVDLSGESKEITGNSALQLQIVTQFRSVRDPAAVAALEEAAVSGDLDAAARRHLNAPMYIVSSADKAHGYWPSLAERSPERVVLAMIVRTAKLSAQRLLSWMQRSSSEAAVEEAAIASVLGDRAVLDKCDVVLKVNKALLNKNPKEGPAFATLSVFANTSAAEASISNLVVCEAECAAHPIQEDLVSKLRRRTAR